MNLTNPAIMRRKEQVNAVLDQTKEQEESQRQHMEVVVLRTQKIQELETKLEQQLANIATSSGGIPATINTSTSGSGSTARTVTKEEMMQMFVQFTKKI